MAHEERSHSELGGSGCERWMNCPGSVALCRGIPKPPPSEAALEGTKAHELVEIVLEDFLNHKLTGSDPDIRAHLYTQDDDMLEAALGFRDVIWKEVLQESVTGKAYGIEEGFTFSEELKSFGTIDFWCVYIDDKGKRVGAVVDFKYGYHGVDAEDNFQLRFYAASLLNFIKQNGKNLDLLRICIYQPRDGTEEPFRSHWYTAKQIDTFYQKALKAAHSIYVEKSTKVKTGKWCTFCPGQGICEAYGKEVRERSALSIIDAEETDLVPPASLSDEVVVKVVENFDMLINYLKSIKKYAMAKALNGSIQGLKVVEGPSKRKWRSESEVITKLEEHLPFEELVNHKLKGITEIEKTLKKMFDKGKAQHLMSELTEKRNPPLLVVPSTDHRQAVVAGSELLTALDFEEDD